MFYNKIILVPISKRLSKWITQNVKFSLPRSLQILKFNFGSIKQNSLRSVLSTSIWLFLFQQFFQKRNESYCHFNLSTFGYFSLFIFKSSSSSSSFCKKEPYQTFTFVKEHVIKWSSSSLLSLFLIFTFKETYLILYNDIIVDFIRF